MSEFKKCKVIMLPTKDITGIVLHSTGLDKIVHTKESELKVVLDIGGVSQHLYITSEEEIEEGDYYFDGIDLVHRKSKYNKDLVDADKQARKIVATTDTKLLPIPNKTYNKGEYLSKIPESFIKQYCEAGGIDEVMVEQYCYAEALNGSSLTPYNVYKLKINSNNCIIIKPIKESWTREEVEDIHVAVMKQGCLFEGGEWSDEHERLIRLEFNKYAKQNL